MSITTPQNDAVVEALHEASEGRESRGRARRRRSERPRKVKVHYDKREALAGYLFILPWIIGFLVFTAGAMIYSLYISFSNYNLATNTASPAGFDNYAGLFEDPSGRLAGEHPLLRRAGGAAGDHLRPGPRDAAQPRRRGRRPASARSTTCRR